MASIETVLERQKSLGLKIPKSVAIVGAGGVGSWVAYFLALAGVKEMWLFDHDVVSATNLNRMPLSKDVVGVNKAAAMAKMIESMTDCFVIPMGYFESYTVSVFNFHKEIDWIIAVTDTLSSRQMIKKWADEHKIKYIEGAAEGEIGSATGEPAGWRTSEEDKPGYASVPVFIGPCVFAAGIIVSYVLHDQEMGDGTIRMGWSQGGFEVYNGVVKAKV